MVQPWARPIQSMLPNPTSWRSVLILSSHLRLDLPSGLFATYSYNSISRSCFSQNEQLINQMCSTNVTWRHVKCSVLLPRNSGGHSRNSVCLSSTIHVLKIYVKSRGAHGTELASIRSWKDVSGSLSNFRAAVSINKYSKNLYSLKFAHGPSPECRWLPDTCVQIHFLAFIQSTELVTWILIQSKFVSMHEMKVYGGAEW
jgi:hypothetical protein